MRIIVQHIRKPPRLGKSCSIESLMKQSNASWQTVNRSMNIQLHCYKLKSLELVYCFLFPEKALKLLLEN